MFTKMFRMILTSKESINQYNDLSISYYSINYRMYFVQSLDFEYALNEVNVANWTGPIKI